MTESADTRSNQSVYRLRWIGYGLLVFSAIDAIQLLIPLKGMDPVWQFQTWGALVQRVPVPLLGLGLVFFGEFYDRVAAEKVLLQILSWVCLLLSVLFGLSIFVGVFSTVKLDHRLDQYVDREVVQQLVQLKQIEAKVDQSRPEELQALGDQLGTFGVEILSRNPEALKTEITNRIGSVRTRLQARVPQKRQEEKLKLLKNSISWGLGALIASTLFFLGWKSTDWAR